MCTVRHRRSRVRSEKEEKRKGEKGGGEEVRSPGGREGGGD